MGSIQRVGREAQSRANATLLRFESVSSCTPIFLLLPASIGTHQKSELTKLILGDFKNPSTTSPFFYYFRCHRSEQVAVSILNDFGDFT